MNVKGLKITDIINIDLDSFNRLNESELRAITSRLVSASNKRIRRLKEHDINSPAIQSLGREQSFSTKLPQNISKQQRVNRLRAEYSRARSFLTAETSTISGFNAFKKRTIERIKSEMSLPEQILSDKIDKMDFNKLFKILHTAQKKGFVSSMRGSAGSVHARNVIAEILIDNPRISQKKILDWLERTSTDYYELKEEEELNEDETEEFDL